MPTGFAMIREQGQVKFFDTERGFGFVKRNGVDYFVHISNIRGGTPPRDGETVEFKPASGRDGPIALDVERVNPPKMIYEEGRLERYDPTDGYGFVCRGPQKGDVFIHASDLKDSESALSDGVRVGFQVRADRDGGVRAYEIEILEE